MRTLAFSSGSWLVLLAIIPGLVACGHKPIPADKTAFAGEWKTPTGFILRLDPGGAARLIQSVDRTSPEFDSVGIKVAPRTTEEMSARFTGANRLEIGKEFLYGRRYRIDRAPYRDGDSTRMVLNGVTFTRM